VRLLTGTATYAGGVDRFRYVGEPVAVVVAPSAARAKDGPELVDVDSAPLPPAVDVDGDREVPVWPGPTSSSRTRSAGAATPDCRWLRGH
jgi:CO/xanthine dehydrogenase Mo-binding subunit